MDYISTKRAAEKWNITANRITILCKNGRINGAIQIGTRWFIPKNTQKPKDKRYKNNDESDIYPPFRFYIYDSRKANEFNPPLTNEEIQIRRTYSYFHLCEFKKSKEVLSDIYETSKNKYNRIYGLFAICMISVLLGEPQNFLKNYAKLNYELQEDFPRKKELSTLPHEIDGILGATEFYVNEFEIDSTYSYDQSYLSHLAYLSIISLFFVNKDIKVQDLTPYEITCRIFNDSSYLVDAQTLHFYLGVAYGLMNKKEDMAIHIKKALELAKSNNLYWLPSLMMFYYKEIVTPILLTFPKDFSDKIIDLSEDIKKRFSAFIKQISTDNMYKVLLSGDYTYIFYALKGYSNKEIATILNTTESSVNNKYNSIYKKLNLFSKKELVEYYLQSNIDSAFNKKS